MGEAAHTIGSGRQPAFPGAIADQLHYQRRAKRSRIPCSTSSFAASRRLPARAHAPRRPTLAGEPETRIGCHHPEAARNAETVAHLRIQTVICLELPIRRKALRIRQRPQPLRPARRHSPRRRQGEREAQTSGPRGDAHRPARAPPRAACTARYR